GCRRRSRSPCGSDRDGAGSIRYAAESRSSTTRRGRSRTAARGSFRPSAPAARGRRRWPASTSSDLLLQTEQACGVAPADLLALVVGDRQRGNRLEHRRDAADLVRVVAAGEHVIGAREIDGQLQRALVEVHGVVVEVLQIRARLLL